MGLIVKPSRWKKFLNKSTIMSLDDDFLNRIFLLSFPNFSIVWFKVRSMRNSVKIEFSSNDLLALRI